MNERLAMVTGMYKTTWFAAAAGGVSPAPGSCGCEKSCHASPEPRTDVETGNKLQSGELLEWR
jgi:hypothetical protein